MWFGQSESTLGNRPGVVGVPVPSLAPWWGTKRMGVSKRHFWSEWMARSFLRGGFDGFVSRANIIYF